MSIVTVIRPTNYSLTLGSCKHCSLLNVDAKQQCCRNFSLPEKNIFLLENFLEFSSKNTKFIAGSFLIREFIERN